MVKPPPKTALSTAAALTRIKLRQPNGDPGEPLEGCWSACDLEDGFYQFLWDTVAELFSFDLVVEAQEFDVTHIRGLK